MDASSGHQVEGGAYVALKGHEPGVRLVRRMLRPSHKLAQLGYRGVASGADRMGGGQGAVTRLDGLVALCTRRIAFLHRLTLAGPRGVDAVQGAADAGQVAEVSAGKKL